MSIAITFLGRVVREISEAPKLIRIFNRIQYQSRISPRLELQAIQATWH
jgi:hypothetical protein